MGETRLYLLICFAGVPFITAYNVISSIFRGAGDSRRPMYFVAVACVVNIALDFVLIGGLGLGAAGAALGTVLGQAVSVLFSLFVMRGRDFGFRVTRQDIRADRESFAQICKVGAPIACQDGLIQVAFIVITVCWGAFCAIYNQFLPQTLVGLFTRDDLVLAAGCAYLRAYAFDTLFAAVHFCFSGYFCGDQKAGISFLHNIIAIVMVRIPGAYLAGVYFPDSLYPMGWAAPLGLCACALPFPGE